jgi:thiamine phosphate synthase YjbQ (UPF0047 family)
MEKTFHLRTTEHDQMIDITDTLESWITEEAFL